VRLCALEVRSDPNGPAWDTIIGRGRRAGTRVLSNVIEYLGQTFDLHLAASYLVFPHHEMKSRKARAPPLRFVRHWLHFEHLKVEGETMSKEARHYYTFRVWLRKVTPAAGIRYFLLSVPCRNILNFTFRRSQRRRKDRRQSARLFGARLGRSRMTGRAATRVHAVTEQH